MVINLLTSRADSENGRDSNTPNVPDKSVAKSFFRRITLPSRSRLRFAHSNCPPHVRRCTILDDVWLDIMEFLDLPDVISLLQVRVTRW